jgi:hypothetical protein
MVIKKQPTDINDDENSLCLLFVFTTTSKRFSERRAFRVKKANPTAEVVAKFDIFLYIQPAF